MKNYKAFLKDWNKTVDVAEINFHDQTITWIDYDVWTKEHVKEIESFDDVEIMEPTGLVDSNENYIYNKDVALDILSDEYGEIVFNDGAYYLKVGDWYDLLSDVNSCIEIHGNIFENKELLGGR
ncbi:YopX family protein [Mammaliicoccus sciuri]|uniref:YopX family protein n=1 Tax=Mammaliicoccus sciuri TaxID=1296 RepID=UPI001D0D2ABA|nr:YopX family protein [Mammaliicoccus sciuri]MCC2087927.1 YopX family protein [Mammaliicoccus sciuri]